MAVVTITLTDDGDMVNSNINWGITEDLPEDAEASPAQMLGKAVWDYLSRLADAANELKEHEDAPADDAA